MKRLKLRHHRRVIVGGLVLLAAGIVIWAQLSSWRDSDDGIVGELVDEVDQPVRGSSGAARLKGWK